MKKLLITAIILFMFVGLFAQYGFTYTGGGGSGAYIKAWMRITGDFWVGDSLDVVGNAVFHDGVYIGNSKYIYGRNNADSAYDGIGTYNTSDRWQWDVEQETGNTYNGLNPGVVVTRYMNISDSNTHGFAPWMINGYIPLTLTRDGDGTGDSDTPLIKFNSNETNTEAIVTFENTAGDVDLFRVDATPEGSVSGSIGDMAIDATNGFFYLKTSGSATNTGWQSTGGSPTYKSYSLANPGNAGTFYIGGHYAYASADANLTIGGAVTQTFGSANEAHGSHAFAVASGAGGTDLVLTVTGVSITDAGVKNDTDSEVIVPDADAASTNQYFETSKKWLGQITYTLSGSAGTFDFNYGFVKYEDFGNKDFMITDFEATGEARANETGLNIELLYHEATAFIYDAAAFIPNQTALISLATDYGTNNDVASGDGFAYKRTGMSTIVNGNDSEGIIIRITTAVNNSINDASFHIGVALK